MSKDFKVTYRLLVEKEGAKKAEWVEVTGKSLTECYDMVEAVPGVTGIIDSKKLTDTDSLETRIAKEIFDDTVDIVEDIEEEDFENEEWFAERSKFYEHLLMKFALSRPVNHLADLKLLWTVFNSFVKNKKASRHFANMVVVENGHLEELIENLEIDDKTAEEMRAFYNKK